MNFFMNKNKIALERGFKIGMLTVLGKDNSKKGKNSYYLCRCECGNEKSIMRSNLLSGNTVSCGCYRKERAKKLNIKGPIDVAGNRFGKLLVIERGKNTSKGQAQWWCICDCGEKVLVPGTSLRNGNSTSCGCKRTETIKSLPSTAIDLIGQKFGRLTVIHRGPNDKRNQARWWCLCECGAGVLKKGNPLRSGRVKSCGCLEEETRIINCSKRKVKHGLYKHPLYYKFQSMISRCYRESDASYVNYGARGIGIFDEWRNCFETFYKWALENGWEPDKDLSIDRIDNNGDYCPENCRIIPFVENTIKRFTDKGQGLVVSGSSINIRDMIRLSGVSPETVKKLCQSGYEKRDIIEYGKLPHHQKIAVGKSISAGQPLLINQARKVVRKHKTRNRPSGYSSYMNMKGRCYNPNNPAYSRYGGRGIKVCEEWFQSFDNFIRDMGPSPYPDAAIERVDNDGNYEPSNCKWVSRSENTRLMHTKK